MRQDVNNTFVERVHEKSQDHYAGLDKYMCIQTSSDCFSRE